MSKSSPLDSASSIAERTDFPANEGTTIPPCSTSRTTVPFAGAGTEALAIWLEAAEAEGAVISWFPLPHRRRHNHVCHRCPCSTTRLRLRDASHRVAESGRRVKRIALTRVGNIQRLSGMVRRSFFQVFVLGLAARQKQLSVRRNLHIVRRMQIFQHLLRNAGKYRRGNLPALMQSHRRIQNHRNRDRWIVDRRESRK